MAQSEAVSGVAYVDMKRLLDNAPQVAESRERLAAAFRIRSEALANEQQQLDELEQQLASETPNLSLRELEELRQQAEQLRRSTRRTEQSLRQELADQRSSERARLEQLILDTVVELARERNIDLIVPSPVIYASPRIDLTDQVLQRLEQRAQGAQRSN